MNLGSADIAACAFAANRATGGGSSSSYDGSYGGGVENFIGSLGVSGSTFVGYQAVGAGGPLAGVGVGGALDLEDGTATVSETAFTGNQGLGGLSGAGGSDGDGIGVGIYALGMFSFDSTTVIKRNRASTSHPNT